MRRTATLALALALTAPSSQAGAAAILEERTEVQLGAAVLRDHAPVYVLDSGERHPPTSVRAAAGLAPGLAPLVAREPAGPRVYARAVVRPGPRWPSVRAAWLQYWTFHRDNPQDRGIVRTGRHAGDWELVQVRLDRRLRPVAATYLQHTWAERCPWSRVRRAAGRPVVYVANGSHAAYFRPGSHDRPLPDPTDEADGRGARLRPPVRDVGSAPPRWLAWPGRWGAARPGLVPGEHASPRGPAFQADRWRDPAALEAAARPCGAGAPGRWWAWPAAIGLAAGAVGTAGALLLLFRARRRRVSRAAGA